MGVDLHKKWGDHGQNRNRMLMWGIRTAGIVTKTSISKAVSIELLLQTLIGT